MGAPPSEPCQPRSRPQSTPHWIHTWADALLLPSLLGPGLGALKALHLRCPSPRPHHRHLPPFARPPPKPLPPGPGANSRAGRLAPLSAPPCLAAYPAWHQAIPATQWQAVPGGHRASPHRRNGEIGRPVWEPVGPPGVPAVYAALPFPPLGRSTAPACQHQRQYRCSVSALQ